MDKATKTLLLSRNVRSFVWRQASSSSSAAANSSNSSNNSTASQDWESKSLFKDGPEESQFKISYDSIRSVDYQQSENPFIKTSLPETISRNVKNVQGWRGGAQRGFRALYPDVIQVLTTDVGSGIEKLKNDALGHWYRKVLGHNLSPSTLGKKQYGILVPITYKQLRKDATNEQMNLAHALGWGVELHRAFNALTNETMGLTGNGNGNGNGGAHDNPLTFADKHGIGNKAFNDALLVLNAPHVLLQKYFRNDPNYVHYLDAFMFANRSATTGRLLQFKSHPMHKHGFDAYTYRTYRELVRHVVSTPSYVLPVSLALHLAGLNDPKVHHRARSIFEEVGLFAQVNRDYAGYFLEDNDFRDIREGRLTWMIAVARQRVNPGQRKVLDRCYGDPSAESVAAVRAIYKELKMKRYMLSHLAEKQKEIVTSIQQISKVDKLGLSQEFIFKVIKAMETMDITKLE